MSILDQIANPQMADIVGALNVREERLRKDEERRKEIRMGQLIAEALPNIREGSPLHTMATEMPREFAAFTKAIGVPLNDGERMQQFADDTEMLYTLAQDDPRAAMQYALDTAEDRREAGQDPVQLDRFIAGMRDDPQRTMTGLFLTRRSLNRDEAIQDRKLDLESRALDIQEQRLAAGATDERPYYQPVSTAQGVFAFNARTGQMERISDEAGAPILKTDADVDLTRSKAAASAEGKGTAENLVDAKKDLSRIEANADQVVGLIDELLKHPGRDLATGTTAWVPKIPGTDQAGFINRFDQIKGDAFLQAFQTLRGGGAITETEGAKATQAVNRMDRASSRKEFDAAAKDFIDIVETGRVRARKAAGLKNQGGSGETAAQRLARLKGGN